ncbi:MAG TPA: hypothetical protein VNU72_11860 [Puia sp.]|jgi:hypothetical protein|nr:hypothetical protein [Puia sp.]
MDPAMNSSQFPGKFFFRFSFIFLGGSTILCWDNISDVIHRAFSTVPFNYEAFYGSMRAPLHWLDAHLFHTGYDPKVHGTFPGDNHFGALFYLSLLLVALIGAIAWSILDRKRQNYDRLNYWFRVYLRYILAIVIFSYGLDKLIPVQMSHPNIETLLLPFGQISRFSLFWNFMGVSPGYMIVTGSIEVIGALLLLNRHTVALGCIVVLGVLINVVSLNIFYNVPVKLYSTQLLLYTLFLLYPYGSRLVQLFFAGRSVSLTSPGYGFQTPWKKNMLTAALIGVPFLLLVPIGIGIVHRYHRNENNARLQKDYEVTAFVAKDTLPPLSTDTLRWRRFLISYSIYRPKTYAIVWDMQDDLDFFDCEIDSSKKTFTLADGPDSLHRHVFSYSNPEKAKLMLTGTWKDKGVQILMNDVAIDSMWLNRDNIRLIRN